MEYENFLKKYEDKTNITKKVTENIEHIYHLFEYPKEIRQVIYTTNPIESFNSALRKVTRGKGSFPTKEAVLKVLYLRVRDLEKKWSKSINNWNRIVIQLAVIYEDRVTKYLDI